MVCIGSDLDTRHPSYNRRTRSPRKGQIVRQKGDNVSSLPFVVQMVYMDTNYIGEYKRGKIYPNQLLRQRGDRFLFRQDIFVLETLSVSVCHLSCGGDTDDIADWFA